jgi:predicted nicotinamide N-methyase
MRSVNDSLPDSLPYRSTTFALRCADGERSFLRPADPDTVLGDLTDEQFGRDEQLPYWAEHWPSAEAAAHFLVDNPLPPGSTVCELGCGLGVLSAVVGPEAAMVISTDISLAACRFADANLRRHLVAPRVVCADWRNPSLRGVFDVVVAADVLYEERWVRPVITCVDTLLCGRGVAFVADPCRRHWPAFIEAATNRGFGPEVVFRESSNEGRTTVEVLKLARTP